jgi:succinate dehydrogenase / fumarate reductase cytochrome b subunit
MKDNRPVNLDLTTVIFPITAIASILHRVCAVIVWTGVGFYLVALYYLLSSKENFEQLYELMETNFLVQFIAWGLLSAFSYYCTGSLKHIIQDFGYCEDFAGGKVISWVAIVLGVILSIFAGVAIWL